MICIFSPHYCLNEFFCTCMYEFIFPHVLTFMSYSIWFQTSNVPISQQHYRQAPYSIAFSSKALHQIHSFFNKKILTCIIKFLKEYFATTDICFKSKLQKTFYFFSKRDFLKLRTSKTLWLLSECDKPFIHRNWKIPRGVWSLLWTYHLHVFDLQLAFKSNFFFFFLLNSPLNKFSLAVQLMHSHMSSQASSTISFKLLSY